MLSTHVNSQVILFQQFHAWQNEDSQTQLELIPLREESSEALLRVLFDTSVFADMAHSGL